VAHLLLIHEKNTYPEIPSHSTGWLAVIPMAYEKVPIKPDSIWLVVSTPLKNISQWEGLSHILWKIKNVPNHQSGISPISHDGSMVLVYMLTFDFSHHYIPMKQKHCHFTATQPPKKPLARRPA
jgi:hypothetical protein